MPRGRLGLAIRAVCAALALALSAFLAPVAQAQVATAQGSATAVVVTPLTLVKVEDLNFGRIAPRANPGTVTVNVNTGTCTVTGGLIHQGACQFAEFAGMGTRRMTVRFQIPTTVTLTGPAGATMLVDTMTLGTQPGLTFLGGNGNGLGNGNRRYSIDANSGIFTFRVAGRLNFGANQRAGVYSGSFPVTVQYQ
jgi:spore coat protein U-like protein